MVGDGPDRQRLKRRAWELGGGNVRFMDPILWDQVPGLLAASDIGITFVERNTSRRRAFQIYEIMGAGRPLVRCRCRLGGKWGSAGVRRRFHYNRGTITDAFIDRLELEGVKA